MPALSMLEMPERKSLPLRISPSLYEEIKAWAEQDMRSVNSQIEVILRDAVQKRKGTKANSKKKAG
jgi:hypothetical protein